jgi:hypothetical protein
MVAGFGRRCCLFASAIPALSASRRLSGLSILRSSSLRSRSLRSFGDEAIGLSPPMGGRARSAPCATGAMVDYVCALRAVAIHASASFTSLRLAPCILPRLSRTSSKATRACCSIQRSPRRTRTPGAGMLGGFLATVAPQSMRATRIIRHPCRVGGFPAYTETRCHRFRQNARPNNPLPGCADSQTGVEHARARGSSCATPIGPWPYFGGTRSSDAAAPAGTHASRSPRTAPGRGRRDRRRRASVIPYRSGRSDANPTPARQQGHQTRCGNRRANSRKAAIPLDSARSRQSQSCFNNWSVDALDRLQSSLNSRRIE